MITKEIIEHYLNWFPVRSFYFAMFAPYFSLTGEYHEELTYRPTALVIGRPITKPPAEVGGPVEAAKEVIKEIESTENF